MSDHYNTIGDAAGKIYRSLEKGGPLTLSILKKDTGLSDTAIIHQAIGWLAREGKMAFDQSGRNIKFSIAHSPVC